MKQKTEDNDPNWKNGIYIGPANIGPYSDLEAYKEYATALAKKGKDFMTFSEWMRKKKE